MGCIQRCADYKAQEKMLHERDKNTIFIFGLLLAQLVIRVGAVGCSNFQMLVMTMLTIKLFYVTDDEVVLTQKNGDANVEVGKESY